CGGSIIANVCGGGPRCTPDGWCWSNPLPQGAAFSAFFPISSTDIWGVGNKGLIAHFNGTSWTYADPNVVGYIDFDRVWASAANDVWIVGYGGAMLHWDGDSFAGVDSSTSSPLGDIWGSGPNDIWAVGDNGTIIHYTGSAAGWNGFTSGDTNN